MKAAIGCLTGLIFGVCASAEPLLEGRVRLISGDAVAYAQVQVFDMTDLQRGAVAQAMTDDRGYFALPLAGLPGLALPARFELGANYPNPFNPSTLIPYQLAASSHVRLEVFNLLGQRIATLVEGERPAGVHTAVWDATDASGQAVGAGVYLYRLTVGGDSQTGRMVLVDGQAGVSAVGGDGVWPVGIAQDGSYGLVVSGSGLAPYVVADFGIQAGMAPMELMVEAHPAGKALGDDDSLSGLFDLFNTPAAEEDDAAEEAQTDSTANQSGPDLIVPSVSASDTTLTAGQAFTLYVTVQNQGDEPSAATTLRYYRSNNATITSGDTEEGTDAIGALNASATRAESIGLTAPTRAGTYYYGACVESVSGESKTDNNCSHAVTVAVSGQETSEEAGTSDEQEKEEEEVAENEVVRSGQAPIDHPERWMDDLPEHDVLRIELVYLDNFPQWQKDEMRWAADLWELAFTRELPDYDVAEHDKEWLSEYLSSQSVSGQPVRVPNVIDDILVYVIKIPDDDPYARKGRASTLLVRPHEDPGSCRPAYIGEGERLTVDPHGSCMGPTVLGIVYIVDAENNERYGVVSVDYTFAHEIGHVLGIGSTWLQYVYEASETGETYYEKEPHFPDPYKHYYLDAPHVKAAFAEMNDLEVQREIMQSEGGYPDEDIEYAMSLGPWPTELVPMELYVTGTGPLQHWPQFPLGNSVMGGIGLITEPRISKVDLGILADIGYDVGEAPTKPIPFWRYGVYNDYSRDKDGNRVSFNYAWGWNNRGPTPPRGRGKANVSGGAVHWCGGADLPAMEVLRRH